MVTFRDAAALLGPDDEATVLLGLDILHQRGSALARRLAGNLDAEFRLSVDTWNLAFQGMLSQQPLARTRDCADKLLAALRASFGAALKQVPGVITVQSVQPVGPAIADLRPKAFGRMVTMNQLSSYWQWPATKRGRPRRRPMMPAYAVQNLIEDLATPGGWATYVGTATVAECPLGRYVIWSTFDADNFDEDPFVPRAPKFKDLLASLGLDSLLLFDVPVERIGDPSVGPLICLLLTYELPAAMAVHVPTVVEAYAGNGRMNYYFEVWRGDVDVAAGQFPKTLAVPSHGDNAGVPEVVHSVVFANRLAAPIEIEALA